MLLMISCRIYSVSHHHSRELDEFPDCSLISIQNVAIDFVAHVCEHIARKPKFYVAPTTHNDFVATALGSVSFRKAEKILVLPLHCKWHKVFPRGQ